mmetsp:Transcript_73126/g.136691  ORF Transcript_73126/g.136691 Transcript_73126/m.136691 type:complete len:258 (+) Transcript_73126:111-884(+)
MKKSHDPSQVQTGLEPLRVFCCGFSLDTGIKVILFLNSLQVMGYTMMGFLHNFAGVEAFGHAISFWTEVYNSAFALATVPFIICGISGVKYHNELHLRLYLYWLMLTCFLDFIFASILIMRDICTDMPSFFTSAGGAFVCGVARIQSIALMALMLIFCGYAIFTVWSRCEELRSELSEENFDDLLAAKRLAEQRKLNKLRFGIYGTGPASEPGQPVIYGSVAAPIVGGSVPIFGLRHDTKDFLDDQTAAYGLIAADL